MKKLMLGAAGFGTLLASLVLVTAQPVAAQRGNPLEDFLNRIGRDNPNQALGCNVVKRIDRRGDIVYLQMTCRAYGRGR